MAEEKKSVSQSWVIGLILIIFGAVLLITRLGLFNFGWFELYPLLSIALGLLFLVLCITRRESGIVFPAVLFLSLGIYFFLRNYNFIRFYYPEDVWPVIFVALGLSFLALFITTPKDWGVMIPGSLFLFFGITLLIAKMGSYWWWHELVANYWALVLVIIGLSIIVSSVLRKSQKS